MIEIIFSEKVAFGKLYIVQRKKNLEVDKRFKNEQEFQIEIYRSSFDLEINLPMSMIFRYKYYGYRVMSIKFEYLYIEMLCNKAVPEKRKILYHKVHISVISNRYKHTDF